MTVFDKFATVSTLPAEVILRLDRNFDTISQNSFYSPLVVREFVNATSASVTRNLPNGNSPQIKDYHFIKTDATVNTVTITPFTGQYVQGTTSLTLSAQGDSAWLCYDPVSASWWLM